MSIVRRAEEKEKYLLRAFTELTEGEQIKWAKNAIEAQLKAFISYLKHELRSDQRIFENLETRIKGKESFQEKIHRKGYLQSWQVTDSVKNNKNLIARGLPDLIGFRITCFFWEDEESIYQLLKTYCGEGNFQKIVFNFDENREQKNGHVINKVSGVYDDEYCFELQIKSIMHNIWGEVDHKTIYKNTHFDPNIETKKSITEELFNILQAADKQLLALFQETTAEERLLQSLFFVRTEKQISEITKTHILAEHYERFFRVFSDEADQNRIKSYIIAVLQEKHYLRKKISLREATIEEELIREIEANFYEYDLKVLFHITSIIYPFQNYQKFLYYLANRFIGQSAIEEEEVDFDEDDDEQERKEDHQTEAIKNIITLLKQKMGRYKE